MFSTFIFSKTAGLIALGAPAGLGNESLFMGLGQMTKIFAMLIYGKNPMKMFF